jgi:hypothetical protein
VVFTHQLKVGLEFTDSFAHRTVLLLHESDIFPLLVLLLKLSLELQDLSLGILTYTGQSCRPASQSRVILQQNSIS